MNNKIFISHASEDKMELARPLAHHLQAEGFEVWYDEFQLQVGDSLTQTIDRGLASCDFAIIVLSPHFFAKRWTQRELAGLAMREIHTGEKILLPIWHNITLTDIIEHSPPLADKYALLSTVGIETLVKSIVKTVNPQKFNITLSEKQGPFIYKDGHNRYTIKDFLGKTAYAKKTNWFYTTEPGQMRIRDGGMSSTGLLKNVYSNLGEVEFISEAGSKVAYTQLKEPLIPFKIYEHSIYFETINCFLESRESVASNLQSKFENAGNHIFFPESRRPKKAYGALILQQGKRIEIDTLISADGLYLSVVVKDPPAGSRLILEWDW